jgi:hypothetical protein
VVHVDPELQAYGPEGYVEYKDGLAYLKRLKLLTADEKKLFKK